MNAISHTIRLTTGYSRSSPPDPLVTIQATRDEMRALALWNAAQADAARAERRDLAAERFDWRAAELAEGAR